MIVGIVYVLLPKDTVSPPQKKRLELSTTSIMNTNKKILGFLKSKTKLILRKCFNTEFSYLQLTHLKTSK
jgi:hypothetical protein